MKLMWKKRKKLKVGSKNKTYNGKDSNKIKNITKAEEKALHSLIDRIKAGEIVIIPTDKSGRLSVMTKQQFIAAGKTHTDKDELINWEWARNLKIKLTVTCGG